MADNPHDEARRSSVLTPDTGAPIREDAGMGLFVPLMVAVALLVGVTYYFFGDWGASFPHVRSTDSSTVEKSEPSRN